MSVRINAYYPDGSSPHSIDIEWDQGNPPAAEIVAVIEALIPARVELAAGSDFVQRVAGPASDPCLRLSCGHGKVDHLPADGPDAMHGGRCAVCANPTLCRSYVGRTETTA